MTGRFTARDPAQDRRGDGDLYDYCVDDPVSFVDPEGLAAQGVVGQGQRAEEDGAGTPGFWERNLPFWSAHKNEAVRQGIIHAVQGRKEEEKPPQQEKQPSPQEKEGIISEILHSLNSFMTKNKDARYERDRQALIGAMAEKLEPWGRDVLGVHLRTINGRTRGVSDAIINKDLTKITDPLLEKIAEEALKSGRRKKR